MKFISGLILVVVIAFSSQLFAAEKVRSHIKCYLQIEDQTDIVHHFVKTGKGDEQFIENLTKDTVFMADGVTEQKIVKVYECVDMKSSFKNRDAVRLEQNTPF